LNKTTSKIIFFSITYVTDNVALVFFSLINLFFHENKKLIRRHKPPINDRKWKKKLLNYHF